MRYVLIGCGRIAMNHIKAALDNKWEIVGVSDLREERMEYLLKKHHLEHHIEIQRCKDYQVLLSEAKPDVVSIATESGRHVEIALACIERGIHVIIEKPMAMSLADADAIINSAKMRGVKVAACHQNRFNLAVQKMRQALDDGRFGKLSHGSIHVRWNRNRAYYEQASWRGTWREDGGTLMNQCIHGIDLLRWMMGGTIETVYGQIRRQFHPYLEAEDLGMAVVTFANGAVATIEGTVNVFPQNLEETLYLFGEKGTVKLGGKATNHIDVWEFEDETEADRLNKGFAEAANNIYGNGHMSLFKDMESAILEDREPYVDAQAGRDALELVLAIYKSSAEGKPVQLPLGACSTMDFAGLFE